MESKEDRPRVLLLMSWLFVISSLTFDPYFSCIGGTNDKVWARDKGCFQESLVNDDVHTNVMPPNLHFWYIKILFLFTFVWGCMLPEEGVRAAGGAGVRGICTHPCTGPGNRTPSSLQERYILLTAKSSISPVLCLNIYAHLLVVAFSMC